MDKNDFQSGFHSPAEFYSETVIKRVMETRNSTINSCVSYLYWWNYIGLGNLDVGVVTVLFMVFSEYLIRILELEAALTEGGPRLVRAKKRAGFVRTCFKLVFNSTETVDSFVDPFVEYEENGLPCIAVCEQLIHEGIDRICHMRLSPANMKMASIFMIRCARLYQEKTIDAAKTGLAIIIARVEKLSLIKQKSRSGKFGAMIDFANRCVKLIRSARSCEDGTFIKKGVTFCGIADEPQIVRQKLLQLSGELLADIISKDQDLPDDIKTDVKAFYLSPENAAAASITKLSRDMYRSLMGTFQKRKKELEEIYTVNGVLQHQDFALALKPVRVRTSRAYAALSCQLRTQLRMLGYNNEQIVKMALGLAVYDQDAARRTDPNRRISSFAGIVLEEEFFIWAHSLMGEEASEFSGYELENCSFAVGSEITLHMGKVVPGPMGEHAVCMNLSADGSFVVREKDGKLYAAREIRKQIEDRIPESDDTVCVFATRADRETSRHLDEIESLMRGSKTVSLVPYLKGTRLHDAIICDGKNVGKFRCNSGFQRGKSEVAINSLYDCVQGELDFVCRTDNFEAGNSSAQLDIVVLKNCKRVSSDEFLGVTSAEFDDNASAGTGIIGGQRCKFHSSEPASQPAPAVKIKVAGLKTHLKAK